MRLPLQLKGRFLRSFSAHSTRLSSSVATCLRYEYCSTGMAWHMHGVVHRCGLQAIQRPKTKEPATGAAFDGGGGGRRAAAGCWLHAAAWLRIRTAAAEATR
eukprot:SAG25_NODE_134_length_14400_cov_805.311049_15_plen_102_part_00